MELSPEVLIYIQSVKNYFDTNKEAGEYFLSGANEELIKSEDFNYNNGVFIGLPFPNFGLICLN